MKPSVVITTWQFVLVKSIYELLEDTPESILLTHNSIEKIVSLSSKNQYIKQDGPRFNSLVGLKYLNLGFFFHVFENNLRIYITRRSGFSNECEVIFSTFDSDFLLDFGFFYYNSKLI